MINIKNPAIKFNLFFNNPELDIIFTHIIGPNIIN